MDRFTITGNGPGQEHNGGNPWEQEPESWFSTIVTLVALALIVAALAAGLWHGFTT